MRLGVANKMHPFCLKSAKEKIPKLFKSQNIKNVLSKDFHQKKGLIVCKSDIPVFLQDLASIRFSQIKYNLASNMVINLMA